VPADAASRGEAEAQLASARAYAARIEGNDEATVWDSVAQAWERVGDPYQTARARWRQAEAALPVGDARTGRAAGRAPLLEAVRIARELGARPLLRELETLARRALITLPPDPNEPEAPTGPANGTGPAEEPGTSGAVDAGEAGERARPVVAATVALEAGDGGNGNGHARGRQGATTAGQIAAAFVGLPEAAPGPAFGLSNREREVLSLIVLGRTNREIGERLFISQKTVGVHVGNILSKLGVSGRVEAAMVAVRLDLVAHRAR
jgi:DNA-binding CsgD family transcriptional regulator